MNGDSASGVSTDSDLCTIEAHVRHWADSSPDAVALVSSEGGILKYRELLDVIRETRKFLRHSDTPASGRTTESVCCLRLGRWQQQHSSASHPRRYRHR